MVYLAPDKGKLTAVSFRPSQEFDPIIWTGELDEGRRRGRAEARAARVDKQQSGDKKQGGGGS